MKEMESGAVRAIRLRLGQREDVVIWRNQVGVAKYGEFTVPYGLCPGSSDLVGILKLPSGVGIFMVVEVKRPGSGPRGGGSTHVKKGSKQEAFMNLVSFMGGLAIEASSPEEAEAAVERRIAEERTREP